MSFEIEFIKDLNECLATCKKCKNKKYDVARGLLCSLTNKKPTFQTNCPNYNADPLEIKKFSNAQYNTTSIKESQTKPTSFIKFLQKAAILFKKRKKKEKTFTLNK